MTLHDALQTKILTIHRRNGGDPSIHRVDPRWPLLNGHLKLDSLDVAEIMAWLELEHAIHPFDAPRPPATWSDIFVLMR